MDDKVDDGGQAFPTGTNSAFDRNIPGMTLRDWFAGQALAGMLADPAVWAMREGYAADAYSYADAMIAERNKTQKQER